MKKLFLTLTFAAIACLGSMAQTLSSLTWAQVCSGGMGTDWYGTTEATGVADIVLDVQKNNGGWMKNDQLHKLTTAQYNSLKAAKSEHSCLDNYATTQEMRFLAKVYQKTKTEKYRTAFQNALTMIFNAEKTNGGWSQYWPLSGNGSYQDYITFNDDLMLNVMKMLKDVADNKGDFIDMVDEDTRTQCTAAYDRAIQCILNCQIDDNGTKAAWCAQHNTTNFLPTEGRPHELPSVSAYESSSLLSYLMNIEKPSDELKACIRSAVKWLSEHKYMENKYIEDVKDASGNVTDRQISDKSGSAIWGRFIQLGGETGKIVYDAFFKKLKDRNKTRSYTYNGKTYSYTEYEIATTSYDESKAYQPIYSIYTDEYPHLYYRFLYNYADTDPVVDSKGCPIATSLTAGNRKSYQYLGSWPLNLINNEYPAWEARMKMQEELGDNTLYTLSAETATCAANDLTWTFNNGFSITNNKSKGYSTGQVNTVKYSVAQYTIAVPENLTVSKISFSGYNNFAEADSYIYEFNGTKFGTTDYLFPAKDADGNYEMKDYTIELATPQKGGTITFTTKGKQCCFILNIFAKEAQTRLTGDVNGDGNIDISDVNAIISVICASTTDSDIITYADVNADGKVDIADVTAVISIICQN